MIFGDSPTMRNQRYVPSVHAMLQAGNLFLFTMNDPINFLDPSGLYAIDLGRGWRAYIHRVPDGKGGYRRHVHVYGRRGEHWSQNDDGSPHDQGRNSPGSPPNRVLRDLYNKTGWDWISKQETWISEISIENTLHETHWLSTITFPDGRAAHRAFSNVRGFGSLGRPPTFSNNALIDIFLQTDPSFIGPLPYSATNPTTPIPFLPIPMPIPTPTPMPMPIPIPLLVAPPFSREISRPPGSTWIQTLM